MKRILTICFSMILLLSANYNAHAQYASFFADSTWQQNFVFEITCGGMDYDTTISLGCCQTNKTFGRKSDTVQHLGHTYYRMKDLKGDYFYVREDTAYGKLYVSLPNWSIEKLICDMSLEVGDTINIDSVQYPGFSYETMCGPLTVDSAYYLNGRKILDMNLDEDCDSRFFDLYYDGENYYYPHNIRVRFIEGVGPTYGMRPGTMDRFDMMGLLLCSYKDGELVYIMNDTIGCEHDESNGVPTYNKELISVYPNPAQSHITVKMELDGSYGRLLIVDMMGRVVYNHNMSSAEERIDISNLSNGLYCIIYKDKNMLSTHKFVKGGSQ